MPFLVRRIKYPSQQQAEFWVLRRNDHQTVSEIAKSKKISDAAVSQTLKKATNRIRALLESTARTNKICLEIIAPELGYGRGKSRIFKVKAYITYSPFNGVNVWYDHDSDCGTCEEQDDCQSLIVREYQERKIPVPNENLPPAELSERLFQRLEALLE